MPSSIALLVADAYVTDTLSSDMGIAAVLRRRYGALTLLTLISEA